MLAHAPIPAGCTLLPLLALAELAPRLDALGLAWGPAGGAGFQLASGLPVLREDSDLDLLVRAPWPLPARLVDRLAGLVDGAPCRIDLQVDTGLGGFALSEYVRGGRVLLKTAHGPLLVDDPWRQAQAACRSCSPSPARARNGPACWAPCPRIPKRPARSTKPPPRWAPTRSRWNRPRRFVPRWPCSSAC
jgi:hypothetical protein